MKITKIIWFDYVLEKLARKHDVQQEEVKEILKDKPHFRFVEKGHRSGENVYAGLGRTSGGRYLIVFFVYKKDRSALIISAREMTHTERKLYEKK